MIGLVIVVTYILGVSLVAAGILLRADPIVPVGLISLYLGTTACCVWGFTSALGSAWAWLT